MSETTIKEYERRRGREKTSGLSSLSRWAALESSIIASTDKSAECWTQYDFWMSRSFTPFPFPFPAQNLTSNSSNGIRKKEDEKTVISPGAIVEGTESKREQQREESVVMAKCLQWRDETLRNSSIFGCCLSLFAALPYFPFYLFFLFFISIYNTFHFPLHKKYQLN